MDGTLEKGKIRIKSRYITWTAIVKENRFHINQLRKRNKYIQDNVW